MTIPRPPAHVAPYVEALGAEVAVRFFLHFGGAELYIPRDPKGGSKQVEILGLPAARALSALADRTLLPRRVPIPKAWIARYLKVTAGLSHAEIARILHWTDVSVRRALAAGDDQVIGDSPQMSLF